MSKNIIKQGQKPVLMFKCDLCSCEWEDDKYSVSEKPSLYHGLMFGMQKPIETTVSRCPVCCMQSYDGKKSQKESEGE